MRQSATFFLSTGERVAARDDADLVSTDVDAVAVAGGLVPFQLEADQHPLRMLAPVRQRFLADEVVLLVGRHRESDPGLERVDLVVELVAGEDQARFDPDHVERLQPERVSPCGSPASWTASQSAGASFGWQKSS